MRFARSLFVFVISITSTHLEAASPAPTPMSMPSKYEKVSTVPYEDLVGVVDSLNGNLGNWPVHFSSDAQRKDVYEKWASTLQQVWLLEAKGGSTEENLSLLAELYRQGHNMDVIDAAYRANGVIEKCLKEFPNSVRCNFSASYFYLSIDPKFAKKGEAALLKLRVLFAPQIDKNVERGLVFAYLYQGRDIEALSQVEYFLKLEPLSEWAKLFRDNIKTGKVHTIIAK